MRVKLHPDARAELHAARNWYFERSPLSAITLAQTIDNAISELGSSKYLPACRSWHTQFRSSAVSLQYLLSNQRGEIVIVAVAD